MKKLSPDKKLKIAIIGHKRIPSNEGGIEKGVEQHAVRMAALGHDVTVYNRGNDNIHGKTSTKSGSMSTRACGSSPFPRPTAAPRYPYTPFWPRCTPSSPVTTW